MKIKIEEKQMFDFCQIRDWTKAIKEHDIQLIAHTIETNWKKCIYVTIRDKLKTIDFFKWSCKLQMEKQKLCFNIRRGNHKER